MPWRRDLFSPPSLEHSWPRPALAALSPAQLTTWHMGMRKNLPADMIRKIWEESMRPPEGFVFSSFFRHYGAEPRPRPADRGNNQQTLEVFGLGQLTQGP